MGEPARDQGQQQGQGQAIAKRGEPTALQKTIGTYRDAQAITARLQYAAQHFNLVTPTTVCPRVPEGCDVVLSAVMVDTRPVTEGGEVYSVGKTWGLSKSALERIAAAAGISWDAQQSGRTDDGSDPRYCSWKAVGVLRDIDGTEVQIVSEKEMDLREGSPQVEAIIERCVGTELRYPKDRSVEQCERAGREKAAKQIREMRLHIMAHAETKARLRAVRARGLKSSYSLEDLKKPFIVPRLMFTGASDDPAMRAEFAKLRAQAMLGGVRALYGAEAPVAQLPARAGKAPPPIGAVGADADDYDVLELPATTQAPIPTTGETVSTGAPAPKPPASNGNGGATIPGGKGKPAVLVTEAPDQDLTYWLNRISGELADGKTPDKYRARDEARVEAIKAELARRVQAEGGNADEADSDDDGPGPDPEGGLFPDDGPY